MSLEDQQEQEQAKISAENDARIAKNEESLKNAIAAEEKKKEDFDQDFRDYSS